MHFLNALDASDDFSFEQLMIQFYELLVRFGSTGI